MATVVYCPHCGKRGRFPSDAPLPKAVRCPYCQEQFAPVADPLPTEGEGVPPAADGVIFCEKCGKQNQENNFKCTSCSNPLHQPGGPRYTVNEEAGLGGLVPYKNSFALWSYYLGVFSLIPCAAFVLGPAAIFTGVRGLRHCREYPQQGGKGHAIAGIVLGTLTFFGNLAVVAITIMGLVTKL